MVFYMPHSGKKARLDGDGGFKHFLCWLEFSFYPFSPQSWFSGKITLKWFRKLSLIGDFPPIFRCQKTMELWEDPGKPPRSHPAWRKKHAPRGVFQDPTMTTMPWRLASIPKESWFWRATQAQKPIPWGKKNPKPILCTLEKRKLGKWLL